MKMRQVPLSLILFPLPSSGLMKWDEGERKMTSHIVEEKHLVVAVYLYV
jgi:hypothetical protein